MTDTQTATAQKSAVHLTAENFESTINEAGMPVLVDFYADWCGPCKLAAPIIDKLSEELRGKMVIAKLDVDDANELARQYGVMSIPTVIIFQKKEDKIAELDRKIGFGGEDGYRQLIAKHLPTDKE
jgi:thioredoxin 1